MEIVVKRIAKKKTYTIGHLYILNDKDVKRTWRSGVKIGDKRIFEHSFDKAKLDKEHYFCDTLEPTWRNSPQDTGAYGDTGRLVSCCYLEIAKVQEVASAGAGCS